MAFTEQFVHETDLAFVRRDGVGASVVASSSAELS
jgi:hypothetical protein